MEQNVGVVELISTLLDEGKYKEASCLLKDDHVDIFKDNCWDLMSVIINKIQNDTITLKPSLYGACEELLEMVVEHSLPEASLLDFVEKLEIATNDAQFSIILKPLQQLQLKMTKRGTSLEWCLNAISTYIGKIPVPEYQLDGKERLLMDSDDNVRRILFIYSLLPPYYSPFLKEGVSAAPNNSSQILSVFLISLLGKPLLYVDVDPHSNATSEARKCTVIIINDICSLLKNVFKLLVHVECNYKESLKPKSSVTNDSNIKPPFENKDKINMTTLSGFYYAVLSGHFEVPELAVPLVYSEDYVIHTVLPCVVHLLRDGQYGALAKGAALCKQIIKRLSANSSHSILSIPIHYNLCNSLINVCIYCTYESIRKETVTLLSLYINSFNYKGRCMLIKHVIGQANHSGMIGYAITLFKNSLDSAFKESVLPDCFRDQQLIDMIEKICFLPFGAESDLVEHADQIITSLNFLIYLAIKDRKSNKTGILNYFPTLEADYIKKLRIALNMSKAHYEEKLKEIEQNKDREGKETNISVNIGGNMLDKIPTKNKKQIIHSALNAFHLMNGLLAQLSDNIH